jgi:N-acetylneuraminate synthase
MPSPARQYRARKHVTLSQKDKGPDSEFSIEPPELKQLCEAARDVWLALGKTGYECAPAEAASKVFRRSIYFIRDLLAGATITPDDIRPGMGLPPKHFDERVRERLKIAVKRGTPARWHVLEAGNQR